MSETAPAPRAYILGGELKRSREKSGLGQREVARRLDVSHSVIARWEKGERVPSTESVSALLAILGAPGAERDRIVEMTREAAHEPVNTVSVGVAGMADQLAVLMEFERIATIITDVAPLLMPGLLQTGDYARAILGRDANDEAKVAVRLGRRDVIMRDRSPARYLTFIAERVLYQPIGDALRDQLGYLLKAAEQDNISVRVVPTSAGYSPAHIGPFVLMEFAKADPVVHLEHYQSSVFLRDQGDVREYVSARDDLDRMAMSPADSSRLIAETIEQME